MQLSYFPFPALTVLVNKQMLFICIRFSNDFHILARELQQAKAERVEEREREKGGEYSPQAELVTRPVK